jgi:hypothetical protein
MTAGYESEMGELERRKKLPNQLKHHANTGHPGQVENLVGQTVARWSQIAAWPGELKTC